MSETRFDPAPYLIRVQGGRMYLPVAARLIWFRMEKPDWGIVTSPIEINMEKRYAIFSATIYNAEGKIMATATKMENVQGFADWAEKCETGAVGRALAFCGYGTQHASELDEADRFADAPQERGGTRGANRPNRTYSGGGTPQNRPAQGRMGPPRRDEPIPPMPDDGSSDDGAPFVPPPHSDRESPIAGNRCSVDGCSNVLTTGQMTMSNNKFGRALCLLHQRSATPLPQEGAQPR